MDFILKKIIASLLLPFPIALLLLFIGLCFLWCSKGRMAARLFISASFIMLLVLGSYFVPTALLGSLENQFTPIMTPPDHIHQIVVLGGGVRTDTNAPPNTQLSSASLSRLVEGIRLYQLYQKQHQSLKLILSGGRVFGQPAEAGVMQNIAVFLGVNPQDIILEAGSRDTYEEARYLKKQLGTQPFLLVTSAYHMPRAIALFKQVGLHPIAAPTQYFGDHSTNNVRIYMPNSSYLIMSDIAIHEYLGRLWARLNKQ